MLLIKNNDHHFSLLQLVQNVTQYLSLVETLRFIVMRYAS